MLGVVLVTVLSVVDADEDMDTLSRFGITLLRRLSLCFVRGNEKGTAR